MDDYLYNTLKKLYDSYTGEQIADAHKRIRKELEEAAEVARLQQELNEIESTLDKLLNGKK